MTEKLVVCDVCGHEIKDIVYELTDDLGVKIEMCGKCLQGIKEAQLLTPLDEIRERSVDEVSADEQ